MSFWLDILLLMLNTMVLSLFNPLFWLVVFIVFMQYRRVVFMEKKLFGRSINNVWVQTLYSMLFGVMGGLVGSIFLLLLGISLDRIGIAYICPVAILLLFINPRYLCFAYAGGIIAVLSIIIRALLPSLPILKDITILSGLIEIHLPSLLALVGVLHLTESFLIFISGHCGASPIYLKVPSGKIVGGYSMQRFWPLPLMGLCTYLVAETSDIFVGGIAMPDWWPLLGTVMNTGGGQEVVYLMLPLVAGLGYSDLALSSYPHNKRIKTARNLAIYSLLLSSLAIAAVFVPPLIIAAALVAPLGHELLILKGNKEEFSGTPLFVADNEGVLKIMAVVPGSPAGKAGLKGGDRIEKVNNYRINSENDFWNALQLYYNRALLSVVREGKNINIPVQIYPQPISRFGVIFPPSRWNNVYVEMKHSSLWKKIRGRFLPGRRS